MTDPAVHDPITLEILSNALRSVADETFTALQKSAYSTNIKERADHSTALFDAKGQLMVQSQRSLPVHVGAVTGVVGKLLEKFGHDLHEGDIFVANDPYAASATHLPDICAVTPVYNHGRLVGFSGCTAHHADIGGANVGGSSSGLSEIYQEGFRIPLVRLFSRGELDRDLFEMMLLNVRGPELRRGDYNAQFAAIALGAKRMREICDRFGADYMAAACEELISRTRARMLHALEQIPPGEYRFSDVIDDDGMGNCNLPVVVTLRRDASGVSVDFEGTAAQTRGNINSPWLDTKSTVMYAFKAVLDPELSNNHGLLSAIDVRAPEGSLVRPNFPAAVTNRSTTSQRIVDAMLGALAQALPKKVIAATNGANSGVYIYGQDPRTRRQFYFFETMGGGFGARPDKDGKDAVQVHMTNTANTPVEAIEREFPLLVEEYSIVRDSAGAGKFRGGCGLRRVIRPLVAGCTFGGTGERFQSHPWGLFGGSEGGCGGFSIREADGNLRRLPDKVPGVPVGPDEAVVLQTAGGGGYGAPAERTSEAVSADIADGKISPTFAAAHYPQFSLGTAKDGEK